MAVEASSPGARTISALVLGRTGLARPLAAIPRPMRLLDSRDAAIFALDAIDRGLRGNYIVSAPTTNTTYGEWLGDCVAATDSPAKLTWVDDDFLISQKVGFWSELPLWAPTGFPEFSAVWDLDVSRAEAAGLRCRPVRETVFDTWAWLSANGGRVRRTYEPRDPHGLEEDRERAVLAAWDARG